MAVKNKKADIERLRKWTCVKRKDPAYRAGVAERRKARFAQLKADAEFGRKCRKVLGGLKEFVDLLNIAKMAESEVSNG